MKLSEAARTALINAGTNRQGAAVKADPVVVTELYDFGLVGLGDGLTRRGSIERERIMSAELDRAFG